MNANAVPLLAIFEKKIRLEVPLFQRQYVWNQEHQWEPLWDDIVHKFSEYLQGRKDTPVHFLGAMVLDQKQTPTTHVERRQVIDGQQRLTTLQIFLAAFRDFCTESGAEELAQECDSFILNRGMMADPETDRFKVWPTALDRAQFADVITAGSRSELEARHPITRQKYARKPDPRPRMVEAYLFFHEELGTFFLGGDDDPPLSAESALSDRLEEAFQALKNALQVVAIDLETDDDAQVIFETLNARGEALLPADLVRNFIFLRAARGGEEQEPLYKKYWQRFDDEFWREEVKQGRLLRPRSDLFMQHYLASHRTTDIPIKHLFVEYKYWISREAPFDSVESELAMLARQGEQFRRIVEPREGDPVYRIARFLDDFDIRTAYPLLLTLLDSSLDDGGWKAVSGALESYLLRRAVCGLTTKNYNRIFLGLTRNLKKGEVEAQKLESLLVAQTGPSTGWPSDEQFREAWRTRDSYNTLNNPKLVYILKAISDTFMSSKTEEVSIEGGLSVEHLLPREWIENWPLPDGSSGMDDKELFEAEPNDVRAGATRKRNAALQTMGNLTLLTQPLNSSVSNSGWTTKRPEVLLHSLLPLNQALQGLDVWNEEAIERRGEDLFARAVGLWSHP